MPLPVISILESTDYLEDVRKAAALARDGGVVVLPTETVYGAVAALGRPDALARLRELRQNSVGKPLVPHLARPDKAMEFLGDVSDLARRMMKKLWPGPVGLQFDVTEDRRRAVAASFGVAEAELYDGATVTLRCPSHPVFTDVADAVGAPVVAIAAGGSSASTGQELAPALEGRVSLILDAGPSRFSKPSTLVHVDGDRYKIVRPGVYDERIIDRLLKTTILFVCSGNTCRSPMAEAIARRLLAEKLHVKQDELENKGLNVMSAGSFAMPGSRATPQAVDAVKALGADLSRHRSRPLTVELIHEADYIYAMGHAHARTVTAMVPSASDKVLTLDPNQDIEDPIGGDAQLYIDLAGKMVSLIDRRLGEQVLP